MKKGFTLIELLVVIGIIAIISGVSIAAYSKVTKTAEKSRANELVQNVATAITALYQQEGIWPKRLVAAAEGDNLLDEEAARPLAQKGYISLDLGGYDRFGIVTPWALAVIKSRGKNVSRSTPVGSGGKTIVEHTLRVAIDSDGDGFTTLPSIEGYNGGSKVRATVCVWCCSKNGSLKYRDLIKSWTDGQVVQ